MSLLKILSELEKDVIEYTKAAGKELDEVWEEITKDIKKLLAQKITAVQNAQAATANPTTSGPAGALAGSQGASAGSTGSD